MAYAATMESGQRARLLKEEEAVYKERATGRYLRKRKRPRLIDLYSGAGGMTLGFTKAFGHCFDPIWANDFNREAADTYNANFGSHCIHGDIINILEDPSIDIPEADIVIGGPPCQGFSLLNKNRDGDSRKKLWHPFMEVVRRSGAELFVMENVRQLLSSPEYDEIHAAAQALGFSVVSAKLCAADYGVPQTRHRAFIIGCRFADPQIVFPPKRTHYNPANGFETGLSEELSEYIEHPQSWRTVCDAISDLPKPVGTEIRSENRALSLHFGRNPTQMSRRRYRAIPREGMNRFDLQRRAPELTPECWKRKTKGGTDLFGRLWWDRPAFTIRTEFFKPEKGRYLHPSQHRPITHLEAARLQSFPDNFIFCGNKIDIARQIGNAVPPLLAARVADCVFALWLSRTRFC